MKLLHPLVKPVTINQKFGQNFKSYYKDKGLLGHSGTDLFSSKIDVLCATKSFVYSVRNENNPDPMQYRAVYTLVQDGEDWYEVVYGHMDKIYVEEGEEVPIGVALGTFGNTGTVYSGGRLITAEEKLAGSRAGAHLHFQGRKLVRVKTQLQGHQYLLGSNGIFVDKEGYSYLVPDFENGFNGCVDIEPYLYTPTLSEKIAIFWGVLGYLIKKGRITLVK